MNFRSFRVIWLALIVMAGLLASTPRAQAITYGQIDTTHINVGSLVVLYHGHYFAYCSGTLIAPTVFLTASHCTIDLASEGFNQIWVSFDQQINDTSNRIAAIPHTNPAYSRNQSDPHDVAVLTLATPVTNRPLGVLPTAGLLDQLAQNNGLHGAHFRAVGYGVQEAIRGGGPPVFPDLSLRMTAVSEFNALNNAWVRLNQNDSRGNGGTCYGDSGGPNFLTLNGTEILAAITITGDTACQATNVVYRMDTQSARSFLAQYVNLP